MEEVARQKVEQERLAAEKAERERQRLAKESAEKQQKVRTLLSSSKRAHSQDRLDEAVNSLNELLKLEPSNKEAQQLQETLNLKVAQRNIIPLQVAALEAYKNHEIIRPEISLKHGFDKDCEFIQTTKITAERFFENKLYRDATKEYNNLIEACKKISQLDTERDLAEQTLQEVIQLQEQSEAFNLKIEAEDLHHKIQSEWSEGQKAFDLRSFKKAKIHWVTAKENLKEAIFLVEGKRAVKAAEVDYREALKLIDLDLLEKFGGEKWRNIQDDLKNAEKLKASRDWKETVVHFEKATSSLISLIAEVKLKNNQEMFTDYLKKAKIEFDRAKYSKALALYRQALEVPSYESDSKTKLLVESTSKYVDAKAKLYALRSESSLIIKNEKNEQSDFARMKALSNNLQLLEVKWLNQSDQKVLIELKKSFGEVVANSIMSPNWWYKEYEKNKEQIVYTPKDKEMEENWAKNIFVLQFSDRKSHFEYSAKFSFETNLLNVDALFNKGKVQNLELLKKGTKIADPLPGLILALLTSKDESTRDGAYRYILGNLPRVKQTLLMSIDKIYKVHTKHDLNKDKLDALVSELVANPVEGSLRSLLELYVKPLAKAGKISEANKLIDFVRSRGELHWQLYEPLAKSYIHIGENQKARELFIFDERKSHRNRI